MKWINNIIKYLNEFSKNLEYILMVCAIVFVCFVNVCCYIFSFFGILDVVVIKFFMTSSFIILLLFWYYFIFYNITKSFEFEMWMFRLKSYLLVFFCRCNINIYYPKLDNNLNKIAFYLDTGIKLFLILSSILYIIIGFDLILNFGWIDIINFPKAPGLLIINEENFVNLPKKTPEYENAVYVKWREVSNALKEANHATYQYRQVQNISNSSMFERALAQIKYTKAWEHYHVLKDSYDIERSAELYKERINSDADSLKLAPQQVKMIDDSKLSELLDKHSNSSKSQYHQQTNVEAVKDTLEFSIDNMGPFKESYLNFKRTGNELDIHALFFKYVANYNSVNSSCNELTYVPVPQNYKLAHYPDALIIDFEGKILCIQFKCSNVSNVLTTDLLYRNHVQYFNTTDFVVYYKNEPITNIDVLKSFSFKKNLVDWYHGFSQYYADNSSINEPVYNKEDLMALQKEVLKSMWFLGNNPVIIEELLEGKVVLLQKGDSYNFVGISKINLNHFMNLKESMHSYEFRDLKLCTYSMEEQVGLVKHLNIKMFEYSDDIHKVLKSETMRDCNIQLNNELDPLTKAIVKLNMKMDPLTKVLVNSNNKLDSNLIEWKNKE